MSNLDDVMIMHVEGGRNLYGGALQVLYLLEGLAARGGNNVLVCRTDSAIAAAAGPFAEVIGVPMGGDLDIGLVKRLRHLIGLCQPDLIHLHSRIGADIMGGIAARLEKIPVVHSRRMDNPEHRLTVALKYRLHDRVIAISEGIGRVLLAEGLPSSKLRVVRSAVEANRFDRPCERARVTEAFGIPENAPLIGVVSQLIERKGHRYLIDALPALIADHPELRAILFGKGAEEGALRARVAAAGLNDRVVFAGFRHDLADFLPCLDVLVHPATMEGLGVSLLQAASAGTPIVASAVGGIPEAVRHEFNGLLVSAADVSALAAAIHRLLADPALAKRMGEQGKMWMQKEFSVDAMVEGNLAVYRELIE